jgi:hypothetical protein
MLMPKFVEVLQWGANNKDALLAYAAFLAPVTSIIVGLVSYRAVVTGPRTQLQIAKEQSKLTERQLALQEKQFQTTLHQLQYTVFGATEQKWIDDFRDTLGQMFAISDPTATLYLLINKFPNAAKEMGELTHFRNEARNLIFKMWLHLGDEDEQFINKLHEWFLPDEKFDLEVWTSRQREIFDAAQKIVSKRKEKLSFIPTP